MLQDEGGPPWIDRHLCLNLIVSGSERAILQAEAMKLGKVSNTLNAIGRKETTFSD